MTKAMRISGYLEGLENNKKDEKSENHFWTWITVGRIITRFGLGSNQ